MTAAQTVAAPDPMMYGEELSRVVRLFPLGQAVEISTNSPRVEAASRALWSRYPHLFDEVPMHLRLAIKAGPAACPGEKVMARGQGHLVALVRDSENFATVDLRQGFGFGWLTSDVAECRESVVWGFLEPLVYLMVSARHFAQVHASCVALGGRGVILCGESGAGKTCLAYACARAGWQFVSGDAIQIVRSSGGNHIVGRPYSIRFRQTARELFGELGHRLARPSPHGKLDIEVDTADLPIATALEARASCVVFLNRVRYCPTPSYSAVPFDEALAYLEQVVFYGDEVLRRGQKQCLAELLRNRRIVRLTYSDLSNAQEALRRLVE